MKHQHVTDDAVVVSAHDGYQTWTMQLEPVNAINPTMIAALDAALDAALANDKIAAVVLMSGLKVFSGGADASWMASTVESVGAEGLLEQFNATMNEFRALCRRLRDAPLLIIAALEGHTLAGGLELAAACDLRFCADTERLRIGVPEMDLFGCLPSGGGGTQFLTRLMGPSRALQFILDAKPVDPRRGWELGIVERLCPPAEVRAEAEKFALEVSAKAGRIGVACAKLAIFGGSELSMNSALSLDDALHWDTMRRGNFLPGVDAFTSRFGKGATR
jgi:enoyl-CoA hydratase